MGDQTDEQMRRRNEVKKKQRAYKQYQDLKAGI